MLSQSKVATNRWNENVVVDLISEECSVQVVIVVCVVVFVLLRLYIYVGECESEFDRTR